MTLSGHTEDMRGNAMPEIDDDMTWMAAGQIAGQNAEALDETLAKMDRAVDNRIFAVLSSGEVLQPEIAVQAFCEKFSYRRLRRKLEQTRKRGQAAADRLTPHMEDNSHA